MKMSARSLQVAIEGNPFLELMDTVKVINSDTTTYGLYVIKGITENISEEGYKTTLDLFWLEGI